MFLLRNRFAVGIAALAFAIALPACGDDDQKGAAEQIEKGLEEGANEVENEGNELDDDVKGKDEAEQRNK